jgi:FtsZ-binding cell division protein ZapB
VTVEKPVKPAIVPTVGQAIINDEEQKNAPLITIGKEAEIAPMMTAGKQWFDTIRSALRRQKVREWSHRIGTLAFYTVMMMLWINPSGLTSVGLSGDAFGFRFLSFFLMPAGTAIAYFLWPRNLDGIEITEAIQHHAEQLQLNFDELKRARGSLYELNRDPANLSAVAFVATALKSIDLRLAGKALHLTELEWEMLYQRKIHSLADVSTQSVAGMSGSAREQLLSLRQEAMQEARNAYEQVAHTRRALQREADQLESERQGLQQVHDELNERLAKMGDENFFQFVASLFRA